MEYCSYQISYEYNDARGYRRSKHLMASNYERAKEIYDDLSSKLGKEKGPIELPLVVGRDIEGCNHRITFEEVK